MALSGFIGKPNAAGYAYFFLGSISGGKLPAALWTIIPWLPTSILIELVGSLLALGSLPDNALFPWLG